VSGCVVRFEKKTKTTTTTIFQIYKRNIDLRSSSSSLEA